MSIARKGRPGRPPVSVVMPFAGSREDAWAAVEALGRLHVLDGDELLLADNAGVLASTGGGGLEMRTSTGVSVAIAAATGERSPAHARNTGAAAAGDHVEWILFLDADTVAPPELLDRYFAEPIADDVGAVAGGIAAAPPGPSPGIVARYGAHKNFLDAGAHLAHPFMPRAAAANLLVRRAAFDAVGGFFEGLRAAEDTDFSWRLQLAGWTIEGRPAAAVQHRYRDSVGALRRQWRGYAAGRAWLGRRYDGFEPRPALVRAGRRALGRAASPTRGRAGAAAASEAWVAGTREESAGSKPLTARDRVSFAVLDGILGVEELIGVTQSNSPPSLGVTVATDAEIVLIADRYPVVSDPAHEAVARLARPAENVADDEWVAAVRGDARVQGEASVRVEAAARPPRPAGLPPGVSVVYREDDGAAARWLALLRLLQRQTVACLLDFTRRQHGIPLRELAPAALRLLERPGTVPWMLDDDAAVQLTGQRLGELAATGVASFPFAPGR